MERNARTEAVRIDDLPGVRHDGGEEPAPVVPPPLPAGSPSREDVLGRQISARISPAQGTKGTRHDNDKTKHGRAGPVAT